MPAGRERDHAEHDEQAETDDKQSNGLHAGKGSRGRRLEKIEDHQADEAAHDKDRKLYEEEREQRKYDADNEAYEPQPVRDCRNVGAEIGIGIICAHEECIQK